MRISDWSSDVCSSDLAHLQPGLVHVGAPGELQHHVALAGARDRLHRAQALDHADSLFDRLGDQGFDLRGRGARVLRSEEHTSELQSLMRISYAVFCLKKKTNKNYKKSISNADSITPHTQ